MRATRQQRGFAMAFVFVFIALLLIVAVLIIAGAFNAGSSAQAVGSKYGVLNSAEAAANEALNELAENPQATPGCTSGSLNGANIRSCLGAINLMGLAPVITADYATGGTILVPAKAAYIYGEATRDNNRKVYVEAIAQPAPPLNMPGGAINAVHDVNDRTSQPINADPLYGTDADIHANHNINVTSGASPVQGNTYAVGIDQLPGVGNKTNSGTSAVTFPNSVQVQQASQNALVLAQAGQNYTGGQIAANGTQTYSGNVYINGDVNLTSSTVTFSSGAAVYINGNLCVNGTASVVDLDAAQGVMVVKGVVSSGGSGGYQVGTPDSNTLLLVLGNDVTSSNPCNNGATDAAFFAPLALEPVGTVYAANGSIQTTSTGTVIGALDAGVNVDINGNSGAAMRYDHNQSKTTMATGTMTYTSLAQY
ncbi:MAG: hypothetical protein M3Z37_07915 [Candidatus Eremiobacteraeota bacterium]|nr:hypothetical protein [Candidatus Eremiobacteraeota bacterium]